MLSGSGLFGGSQLFVEAYRRRACLRELCRARPSVLGYLILKPFHCVLALLRGTSRRDSICALFVQLLLKCVHPLGLSTNCGITLARGSVELCAECLSLAALCDRVGAKAV